MNKVVPSNWYHRILLKIKFNFALFYKKIIKTNK